MRKARFWGLLWVLFVSEVHAALEPDEERYDRIEGQSLAVGCPFNIMKYANSQKAWQRLQAGREPLTLAIIDKPSGQPTEVHVGKYMLKDDPLEAMLHVQMSNLRVEDSGLYRCVIYYPQKDPLLLFHPVRLVVTKDSSGTPPTSYIIPTPNVATVPTTRLSSTYAHTMATQFLLKSTTVIFSPDPGVTFKNRTDVTRISEFSFIVPVVCGFLSKTLVFIVLFAVTQRSFG